MADGNWDKILAEYKIARDHYAETMPLGKDFIWMEKLIPHLISNRDLLELYPVTSLHVLNLSICKSWEETLNKPYISIKLNWTIKEKFREKYRYEFSLTQHRKDGNICRQNVESIFCSFEKSLEVFDEMIEKLKTISK